MLKTMSWLEQKIRRYEHARWTTDDNRRVLPFAWGLEHIGGRAAEKDPRGFLRQFADQTIASSDAWYATEAASDYRLEGDRLTFSSAVESPWAENNLVRARFFPAKKSGPAVVVMPNWNAKADNHVPICRWLNKLGITALRLTLPYHEERNAPGHERADHLVGPNIGLTIQANRQAVMDVRRCLRWLEQMGYGKLGILGTSIGSSIGFITMCHDRAVRAAAYLHVSTYFGDVVRTGMTTNHVWEGLRAMVSADEIRHYWAPVSPFPYIHRVHGTGQRCLMITGKYDPTFISELSEEIIGSLHSNGVRHEVLRLPCGHYSLGEFPFSWAAGGRFAAFLFQYLT
ncbi:MAG: alpha/beta hydrolase family protein [Acidobacteria bacterium]|nr:alpha/beta hydrolase family protein [Acidobacteriota bacterium]MCL5288267.1 alpha/beta hydrolase family protein [Acidobacteriota bacterium]